MIDRKNMFVVYFLQIFLPTFEIILSQVKIILAEFTQNTEMSIDLFINN